MESNTTNKDSVRRSRLTVPQRSGTAPHANLISRSSRKSSRGVIVRIRTLLSAKPILRIVILVGAVLLAVGVLFLVGAFRAHPNSISKTPEYQTVTPQGKPIDELGGWQRISPPKGEPVFAYADTLDGVSISVSQQPLPKSLEGNTDDHVAELAKKFNATTKIDANGTKVYVGTSAKGPQSAILTKNNLLILIKSQQNISNASWATYAQSLN